MPIDFSGQVKNVFGQVNCQTHLSMDKSLKTLFLHCTEANSILKYFVNKYFMSNIVVFVTFYLPLVNNYAHLQIFYMIWVITRVIRAILHNRCALRFLLVLWCALGTKSLGTTGLGRQIWGALRWQLWEGKQFFWLFALIQIFGLDVTTFIIK